MCLWCASCFVLSCNCASDTTALRLRLLCCTRWKTARNMLDVFWMCLICMFNVTSCAFTQFFWGVCCYVCMLENSTFASCMRCHCCYFNPICLSIPTRPPVFVCWLRFGNEIVMLLSSIVFCAWIVPSKHRRVWRAEISQTSDSREVRLLTKINVLFHKLENRACWGFINCLNARHGLYQTEYVCACVW